MNGMEMMLRAVGFDPADFKIKIDQALAYVKSIDDRLAKIEAKLDEKTSDKNIAEDHIIFDTEEEIKNGNYGRS